MLKRTIVTEAVIHAPPGEVWEVLTNIAEFSESNSTFGMNRAEFVASGDGELTIQMKPGARPFPVPIRFTTVENGRELRWFGGVPALGGGSHFFILEPESEGRTRLTHGEDLTGILPALGWPLLRRSMLDRYQQTTDEIREYCERRRMA